MLNPIPKRKKSKKRVKALDISPSPTTSGTTQISTTAGILFSAGKGLLSGLAGEHLIFRYTILLSKRGKWRLFWGYSAFPTNNFYTIDQNKNIIVPSFYVFLERETIKILCLYQLYYKFPMVETPPKSAQPLPLFYKSVYCHVIRNSRVSRLDFC